MPRRRDPTERSAGGVVVREGEVAAIVPRKRAADGRSVLGLPKGHLDGDETAEQAAAREVREETGLQADLVAPLGEVRYWYQRKGHRIRKSVLFFLFEYRSGSIEDHDDEIEEVRWLPLAEAAERLTYQGEREMVRRAIAHASGDR